MASKKVIGAAAAVAIGIVLAGCSGGADEVSAKAESIVAQCFTEVQPTNYPRISQREEERIISCAFRMADNLADPLGDEVSDYLLFESDLLPDGE